MLFHDSDDYIPFDGAKREGGRGLYSILAKQNGDRIHLVFNVIVMTFQAITVMPSADKMTDIIILNDERKWHRIDKTLENLFVLFGHSFGLIIGCNGILNSAILNRIGHRSTIWWNEKKERRFHEFARDWRTSWISSFMPISRGNARRNLCVQTFQLAISH